MGYLLKLNGTKIFRGNFEAIHCLNYVKENGGSVIDGEVYAFTINKSAEFTKVIFKDCKRYLIYKEKERYNKMKNSCSVMGDLEKEYSDALKKEGNWEVALSKIDNYLSEQPINTFKKAFDVLSWSMRYSEIKQEWKQVYGRYIVLSITKE